MTTPLFKSSYTLGELDVSIPPYTEPGDLLIAAAYMPTTEFDARGETGRFYRVVAEGWRLQEIVRFRTDIGRAALSIHTFVVPSVVPETLRFNIERRIIGVEDVADQIAIDVAVVSYRGVNVDNPIQGLERAKNPDDDALVAVLNVPSPVIQISAGASVVDDLNDKAIVGSLRIADVTESAQGLSGPYSISANDVAARILLSLNPIVESSGLDPIPSSGTGVGRLIEPINPLIIEAFRYSEGSFTLDSVPGAIGAEIVFDSIGCCIGGKVTFAIDPLYEPYTRLIKLYSNTREDSEARILYFSGIPTDGGERGGMQTLNLMDLSKLWLDGPVYLDDYPVHPIISEVVDLNGGFPLTRTAGTTQEYETWRKFLKRRFDRMPEVSFGVGAEGRYIQGRPQDCSPMLIDAREHSKIKALSSTLPPYITDYYVKPDDPTAYVETVGTRSDLLTLAPRKIEEARMGADGVEIPFGFDLPYREAPSYELTIDDRIAIPPFLVIELPDGSNQYVSGARVQITPDTGGGASLKTIIKTRTVPYPETSYRRDSQGRFV